MKRSRLSCRLALFAAAFFVWFPTGAARAQCPLNIEFLEIGDRFAEVRFDTDSPGSSTRNRIRLGESPSSLGGALNAMVPGGWNGSPGVNQIPDRHRAITGLAPSTTYYFDVQVTANADLSTLGDWDLCEAQHCPTAGAQPGGYECVAVGARLRPRFTTAASQGPPPLAPNPPVHFPVSDEPPAVTGATFPVTLDENGLCLDFQAQLDAAGAANPNLVHEVVVPAGGICRPENEDRLGFNLPQKSGSGEVVVRCDADPKMLPPPGIRMDPAYRSPQNCSIESNTGDLKNNNVSLLDVNTAGCALESPCTEGWRFVGFRLAMANHEDSVRNLWAVVAFDAGNGRITVEGDLRGKAGLDAVQLHLPGIENEYAHRSCLMGAVSYNSSEDTSSFLCGGAATGVYTGGGVVSDRISTPLVGCEAGPDPVCETAEPHPFGNYFEYSLVSIQGDTATLTSSHKISNFRGVQVFGAAGACNGFYTVKSANGSQGTIRLRPDPVGNCTGGAIREVGPVAVFDSVGPGAPEANDVHILEVVDSTHIRLLDSNLSEPSIGGWMSVDPPRFSRMGTFGMCIRCRLDRVLVEGGGKPIRHRFVFAWDRAKAATYSNQGAILHSWVQDLGAWFPVHPVTGEAGRSSVQSVLSSTSVMYSITNAKDFQLRNVASFGTPGIPLFSQSGHDTCAEDITVERNLFYFPLSRMGGRPEAQGRYYPSRHFVEFKCGRRVAILGSDFRQNPANSQPSAAAISMSTQNDLSFLPPGTTASDFLIDSNTLWDNGGSIDFVGPGSRVTRSQSARRVQITNNLVRTNHPVWKTNPSGQSGEVPEPWAISPFYGEFLRDGTPSTDLVVENNTVGELMGGDASFLNLSGQYDGTTVIRRNVFPYSRTFLGGLTGSTSDYEPPTDGKTGFLGWINHYRRGSVTPDPFSEWDNVIIPCATDTVTTDLEAEMKQTNGIHAEAQSRLSCDGGCPSNFNNAIIGGAGQTCLDRQAAHFAERMDYGRPAGGAFPNYGADVEGLRDAMGLVTSLDVDTSLETTITLTYQAPDSAACYVDFGLDKLFWTDEFDRLSDGGGAVNRQVDLIDLNGETTYHFRVLCSSDQLRGVFTTGSGVPI